MGEKDLLDMIYYRGTVGPGECIVKAWSVRRVWWKRLLGFAVRRWQFNETYARTADGKTHQTGPI